MSSSSQASQGDQPDEDDLSIENMLLRAQVRQAVKDGAYPPALRMHD